MNFYIKIDYFSASSEERLLLFIEWQDRKDRSVPFIPKMVTAEFWRSDDSYARMDFLRSECKLYNSEVLQNLPFLSKPLTMEMKVDILKGAVSNFYTLNKILLQL